MSVQLAFLLVDIVFKTLPIYDDRASRKAVDDIIAKALGEAAFVKSFSATLVQAMEKQLKFQSHIGCYKLLNWSCLLLTRSQFTSVSKNALWRVATSQASLLHIVLQGSFRMRRACKRTFIHLFSHSPDLYKIYVEELKDSRIPYKDSAKLIWLLLDFSSTVPSLFEQCKPIFLEIYVKAVLNAREKPSKGLSEAFCPLFMHMMHEEFKNVVVPSSVKMLKRNPEIVFESVGVLLKSVNLDLSNYAVEILSVVSPQARHADEGRRLGALAIIGCLSQKSSDPDALQAMFNAVKAVIGGSEGRLAFPYQRIGMINALQELSNSPDGKSLSSLSPTICSFLLSCYKEDGNEEVKLAILSAIASWAARSAEAVQPDVVSFLASGLKEKEVLRRGHLRCLRAICKNADVLIRVSSLLGPLVQLVKTGFTKATQRLDGIYALLTVVKIAAVDIKAEEIIAKERIWLLISQNEPSVISLSLASKLSSEDCVACVDLLEVLFVEHLLRVLETFPVRLLLQLLLFLMCHPIWGTRRVAYDATKKIISSAPQLSGELLLEYMNLLSLVGDKKYLQNTSDTENSVDAHVPFLPSVEVLVKALLVISLPSLAAGPNACRRLIFCSHHPCIISTANRDAVWRVICSSIKIL
ncbi:hypothetical protein HHK36_022454 [Tetracentron sinense]|uniref:Stalled ribosome sensor GCN1-like N-terminal domain-containing protein n=1 Tax=Tetracentron sinense TaxID=13715 RepID=A0A834YPM5_TETSI|nr:hypothetical protein HHK36_022454 [Tetracentron sinense]